MGIVFYTDLILPAQIHPLSLTENSDLSVLNVQNSCIHVLDPLAPHSVALLHPPTALPQRGGQRDGAGGGSDNGLFLVGWIKRQEPLPEWGCDYWWTFQPALYTFSCGARLHQDATIPTLHWVKPYFKK